MTGTYLFLDAPIEETIEYIKECAVRARSGWVNATKIREYGRCHSKLHPSKCR